MTLTGKGFFIWKVRDCEGGSPDAIASAAQDAGQTHVLVKVADGAYPSNLDSKTRADLVGPVAQALRARGIQVWGWHYVYGSEPAQEASVAIRRVQQLRLDGYVIDAEIEYKEPGKSTAARRFIQDLRRGLPNTPIALSSFRFPSYHPQLPWRVFLEGCDYNMPQVYWEKAHNAGAQLARTVREFQGLAPVRPVIPTGPAYKWNGWRPTEEDIREFLDTARKHHLPAVNFFSWDECRRDLRSLWDQIARYRYDDQPQNPPPPAAKEIPEQYIQALNARSPASAAALYLPLAVQVTAARTIQGQAAIQQWIEDLLRDQLPGAAFTITGMSGSGAIRRFSWQAVTPKNATYQGRDTIGLLNGKIAYHYTSFITSNG